MSELPINRRQYLELEKLAIGAFSPLTGFMNEEDFVSVVEQLRLADGTPFPLPVVLDLSRDQAHAVEGVGRAMLLYEGDEVGTISPQSFYSCDKESVSKKIFGTCDSRHPGVAHFLRMGTTFVGGKVELYKRPVSEFSRYELTPQETRTCFSERGWQSIVGFQTRNVPHRAHEYLQRLALEQHDGLFIQPLIGARKRGDYSPEAILAGYEKLIGSFLPKDRIVLGVLSTSMRYAGPREAVFHAIVRRNYGCTHFIIGRDHAGVDDYYPEYAGHTLASSFGDELGIEPLLLYGPYHCRLCEGIVSERTCPHSKTNPVAITEISGTMVRRILSRNEPCSPWLIRPEVVDSVQGLSMFIEEDAE